MIVWSKLCYSMLALSIGLSAGSCAAFVQSEEKKPLQHEDYEIWNTISGSQISNNGHWVKYNLSDGDDNRTLKIRHTQKSKEFSIRNATGAVMSFDSKHVAYQIQPDKELVKKLKNEKTPTDELPQPVFEFLNLESGQQTTISNVRSFAFPSENGDWIAIHLKETKSKDNVAVDEAKEEEVYEISPEGLQRPGKKKAPEKQELGTNEIAESNAAEKKSESDVAKAKPKEDKEDGTDLIIKNLLTHEERRYPKVSRFRFDREAKSLAMVVSDKENSDQDGVYLIDLEKGSKKTIVAGLGNYKNLVFDEPGRRLSFITDRDDYESKSPNWSLYLWYRGSSKATAIAAEGDSGIPEQWWISSNAAPFFSESGKYLFYYTAPKPEVEKEAEESDDNEPEAKLDLWHWQDPLLQPQQLLQAEQEKKRSYIASYNLMTRKRVQIATLEIPDVVIDAKRKSDLTLGITDRPYRKSISWDLPGYRDVYLMNLRTGESRELLTKVRSRPQLSPTGKFLMWWDTESRNWFGQSTKSDSKPINLTSSIDYPLFNELHDTPSDPRPYGVAGWTQGDRSVWIYDRYDIWEIDPTGEQLPKRVTEGLGRQAKLQFRYRRLDFEQRQIPAGKILLSAFNETNKDSGYYQLDRSVGGNEGGDQTSKLSTAILLPESIGGIQKARNSDEVILTRSTFRRYPDIWTTTLEFKKLKRLSEANPQQDDYLWGTAELTRWKAGDGQELEGLIYKPDFFDPSKKYPLMVYFYERNSDNLHRHYVPAAGRSIINFSFYASRGYIIFVPDIPYKTGEPGPSASNAVLPGVEHMVKMGFIDEEKIGMQGHSWGGYQTAYLVTQTNRFACAESGAPVSNMTSAYGGIRWGSGMSRMFQYEKTQSRIGDTLWNARDKYIANSPLFFADRIETPLLILHNDEDGAVPWYQGIELFVAMRRLEKPAWLLNYNGDPHWVMGRANRLDFAKRMQQFFDHYLLEGPLPRWMAEGIPAVDKGKDFGFEEMASETESVEEAAESESTNE